MSPSPVIRGYEPSGAIQSLAARLNRATNALRRSHTRKQARCIGASAKRQNGSASLARKSGVTNASSCDLIASPHRAQWARPASIRSISDHDRRSLLPVLEWRVHELPASLPEHSLTEQLQ